MGAADGERILIVTPGRTGSSLLCAIMAEAGADFGFPPRQSWNPDLGEMEHPALVRATNLYARAHRISGGAGKPIRPYEKALWSFSRNKARRHLAQALSVAPYLKAGDLDLALQPIVRLGYKPRIILSYRRLEPIVASFYMRSSYFTVDMLIASYTRCMRNGLAALNLFGGCVVDFDDVQDGKESHWADAVAGVTRLDKDKLLDARETLSKRHVEEPSMSCLCGEAERLWQEAGRLRGMVINAGRPTLRCYGRSQPDDLQLLEDSAVCSLSLDASVPCIIVKWKGYANSAQFRHAHERIIHMLRQHGVDKLLGDDTVIPFISAEDAKWITRDWWNRAISAGLKATANKRSVQDTAKKIIEGIQLQAPPQVAICSFDELADARHWLKSFK